MEDFRRLKVADKASSFAEMVYSLTRSFPVEERYGMTAQLRRAAISVGLNIAEGCGRHSNAERTRFYIIAAASAREAEFGLELSTRLGLSSDLQECQAVSVEIQKMLRALIARMRKNTNSLTR